MTFTLKQVLDLQWLVDEGYSIRVGEDGRVFYKDSDFKTISDEAELEVTDLFMASTDTPTLLGDRLSDFMYDRYCPQCERYHDPSDIQSIDSDFSPNLPDQMCGDCCIDAQDDMQDEYTKRGLRRSDF